MKPYKILVAEDDPALLHDRNGEARRPELPAQRLGALLELGRRRG